MIKLIVLDIDGVITDGSVIVDCNGEEQKRINLKDIDAIFEMKRRGFLLAAITGENTKIVDWFEKKFQWDFFYRGNKNKTEALKQIEKDTGITKDSICYVGDGKYDIEPLQYAGLGICPANAVDSARRTADIVLQNNGGEGCLWELLGILDRHNGGENTEGYLLKRIEEHTNMFKVMAADGKLCEQLAACSERIIEVFSGGGQLFLCGNGGSAADAQHIAAEFISRFYKERPGLNAEALTTNTSILTAVGNDYSFERIFARQLEVRGRKGDMLIGITTSGRSANVLEALKAAKKAGMYTCMLTGGNDLGGNVPETDYILRIPSADTPRIQEGHIFLGHTIAEYVEAKMKWQS